MTSPVYVPKTPRRRKRSSLKRQRLTVCVMVGVVALLAVAFALVSYFTSRIVFHDADKTKYYIVEEDGVYVMQDEDGEVLPTTEDGNYRTKRDTIVMVDEETGEYTVIAAVMTSGSETLEFKSYDGSFDILLYPLLERAQVQSIRLVNENGDFTIKRNEKGDDFEIVSYDGYTYDDIMFSSLVVATGYTSTHMRLDLNKVKEYGYGEYGLPDDPADAKTYFVITDTSGNTHKVIIGNKIPSGAGYYARHADREEVYILKEGDETTYSATFSTVIFGRVEDFIEPLVVTPMNNNNYFDVTDFQINTVEKITDEMLNDPNFDAESLLHNVITFDYSPIEERQGTFYATIPYQGKGAYAGYTINSFNVDDCLQNLMNMEGDRVEKIFTDEENKNALYYFFKEYGVAYCMTYTSNLERDDKTLEVTNYAYQQVRISPLNVENDSYYVYNEAFAMIVEVSRAHLEYLEWGADTWVEKDIFDGAIAYLQEMTIRVPGYANVNGLDSELIKLQFDNRESIAAVEGDMPAIPPSDLLKVWAGGDSVDVTQFKLFYEMLLYRTLGGIAPISEEQMEHFRAASKREDYTLDGTTPRLVITIKFNTLPDGTGDDVENTYCFYSYGGGSQCFVTLNGNGCFYMLQSYVTKIINDLGRVFTGETITPTGKF